MKNIRPCLNEQRPSSVSAAHRTSACSVLSAALGDGMCVAGGVHCRLLSGLAFLSCLVASCTRNCIAGWISHTRVLAPCPRTLPGLFRCKLEPDCCLHFLNAAAAFMQDYVGRQLRHLVYALAPSIVGQDLVKVGAPHLVKLT